MGSFLASAHLKTDNRDKVVERLTRRMAKRGLHPCDDPAQAERTLIVHVGGGWTSIYDNQEDQEELGKSLLKLTRKLDVVGFSVLVHDSDVLMLELVQNGKSVDQFDSWPGYFSGKAPKVKPKSHVRAWLGCFPGQEDALDEVFRNKAVFADAALSPLSTATGVPLHCLNTSARYLLQDGLLEGYVALHFRSVKSAASAEAPGGPPRLCTEWELVAEKHGVAMPDNAVQAVQVAEHGTIELHLSTRNVGGAGQGLRVEVVDPGGHVDWTHARVLLGDPRKQQAVVVPLVPTGQGWAVTLAEADLPQGIPTGGSGLAPHNMLQRMHAQFATTVHASAIGQARTAGEGHATLRIVPLTGTGTHQDLPYTVMSTAQRPLRAPADLHPTMLDALTRSDLVVGFVALPPEGLPAALQAIAEAIAPWVPHNGKVTTVRHATAGTGLLGQLTAVGRPKISTGSAARFFQGKRWSALGAHLSDGGAQVEVEWGRDPEALPVRLMAGRGYFPSAQDQGVISVGVPASDGAQDALSKAIGAICGSGPVLQAFVTRWGECAAPDATPYEQACGVHGQCTLSRRWLGRWLRGLGQGTLWLGPELHAVVGVLEDGVAVGGAVRLDVDNTAAMEARLAVVLPSGLDWQAGMAQRSLV